MNRFGFWGAFDITSWADHHSNSSGHLCELMRAAGQSQVSKLFQGEAGGGEEKPKQPLQAFWPTKPGLLLEVDHQNECITSPNAATISFLYFLVATTASSVPHITIAPCRTNLCPFQKGSILYEKSDIFSHAGSWSQARKWMISLNSTGVDITSENLVLRSGWCLRSHARCNVRCVHADSGPLRHLPTFLNLTCSGRDSSDWSLHIMPPLIKDSSSSNGYWGL